MSDQIAETLALAQVMAALRAERPVFHSEADFQHHLAWRVHLMAPHLRLRLEIRPDPVVREQVDLLVDVPGGVGSVIELKYLKAAWEGEVDGEPFLLRSSGAHDVVRYDVVKDLERVERFVTARPGWAGHVIVLTNDSLHWRPPTHGRQTIADSFRIHEGAKVEGVRRWGEGAGAGTTRGRQSDLILIGQYTARWADYSDVGGRNGVFRYLHLGVGPR